MNYRRDEQYFFSVQEILDDYVNNSSEKENFPLQVKELGIILKEAFPRASRVQRRVNGGRVWQYLLSKTSRLEEDRVKWEDLPAFTKEFDWLLSSSSDDFFEWIKVQSQDLCEGSRVLTEVKIFKDWTFVVHVNSRKVQRKPLVFSNLGHLKITSDLAHIYFTASFPSPHVAVHIERKLSLEAVNFGRRK